MAETLLVAVPDYGGSIKTPTSLSLLVIADELAALGITAVIRHIDLGDIVASRFASLVELESISARMAATVGTAAVTLAFIVAVRSPAVGALSAA